LLASIGGEGYDTLHVQENDTGPDDCSHARFGALVLAVAGSRQCDGARRQVAKLAACVACLAVVAVSASPPVAPVNFLAARDHFFPGLPYGVVLADFTGDARLDLAIATARNDSVALVTNDGALSFVPVGTTPVALAAAHFNGDAHADLAVLNYASGDVSLLLGNGDGTFQAASAFPVGQEPHSVVAADVNHDNKSDVVVSHEGGPVGKNVSVLLGNGDGTLQAPLLISDSLLAFAVGDFNGDGRSDIVGGAADTSAIAVLLGNGDGSFQPPVYAPLEPPHLAYAFAAGDFDGDGRVDAAAGASDGLYVLFGNGDGTFGERWFDRDLGARVLAVADVDGDATLDLAAAGEYADSIVVRLGAGDRQLQALPRVLVPATSRTSIALGDLNGDLKTDLVSVGPKDDFINLDEYRGYLSVRIGRGDGTFHATPALQTDSTASAVSTGDFNGDGHADLAFGRSHPRATVALLGNGNGTFQPSPAVLSVSHLPEALALGDFDGDSRTDIVASGREAPDIALFGGLGDGTFRPAALVRTDSVVEHIEVRDLNEDSKADLIVVDEWDRILMLMGNGDGTFAPPVVVLERAATPRGIALADFNGDSHVDLAAGQANDSTYTFSMRLGNGDGTFQPPVAARVSRFLRRVAVGDFDRDGSLDLAGVTGSGGPFGSTALGLALGNGDGTFRSRTLLRAPNTPVFLIAADFDGDGNVDLGVGGDNTFWVFRGAGDGNFSLQSIGFSVVPSLDTSSASVADFTSDGRADVAMTGGGIALLFGVPP
jgi:hypothetical protein